ncbi:MAG TPA: iron transporter FeoA [Candidatus Desulfofervidus auxilii]|uniref:Iron transporter FeoA n=1 Tax=Desulfofervidus auxilii TaxID=1621989 RepID=A0A7V0IAE4_DESA2|nr:iron transporter FeoA [Candidatus Desulfofervidus auxilii]
MILTALKKGEKAKIIRVKGDINLKQRLLRMGMVPGEIIEVKRVAPLGDPIDIVIKGYHLSLRKEETNCIEVEVV